MSQRRNFSRGPSFYRRGTPRFQSSGNTFLIVTEGAATEPSYFNALRLRLELSATDVVIVHPSGTDPITLTNAAIKLRDDRKREAKQGIAVPYDEVWVVFDLERTHDQRRAQAKAARSLKGVAGIKFADSDPCFEFWLLLHHEYTTRPFENCAEVERFLKKHCPSYEKGNGTEISRFLDRISTAVVHALRCRKHHATSLGDGNPSTRVDCLITRMNAATREHLRIGLGESECPER